MCATARNNLVAEILAQLNVWRYNDNIIYHQYIYHRHARYFTNTRSKKNTHQVISNIRFAYDYSLR